MTLEDRIVYLEGFVQGLQNRLTALETKHRALLPLLNQERDA